MNRHFFLKLYVDNGDIWCGRYLGDDMNFKHFLDRIRATYDGIARFVVIPTSCVDRVYTRTRWGIIGYVRWTKPCPLELLK